MTLDELQNLPPATPGSSLTLDQLQALPPKGVSASAQPAPAPAQPGFLDGLKSDLAKRQGNVQQSIDAQSRGQQTSLETSLQLGGQAFGLVNDAFTRGTKAVIGAAKSVVPEPIKAAGKFLIGTPFNKAAIDTAGAVAGKVSGAVSGAVDQFSADHPRAARNLGALGETVAAAPIIGGVGGLAEAGAKAIPEVASAAKSVVADTASAMTDKQMASAAANETQRAVDMTRPVLSKSEKAAAIAQGNGKVSGILSKYEVAPTPRDLERADAVKGIVAESKTDVQAIDKINKEIGASAENLKTAVGQRNVIFNRNQLRSAITAFKDTPERQITIAGEEAANKAYDGVVDTFMKVVDKYPKNLSGLLEARKDFDQIAEKGMSGVFDQGGTMTAKKAAIRDIRRMANEFIADQLPEGDAMRGVLHRQNLMFEAKDNIADKVVPKVGTNSLGRLESFVRKHPVVTGAGAAAGTYGAIKGLGKILP